MEEVWLKFEEWFASFSSDANMLTKKGFAANAFEAGWKAAQQKTHLTALRRGLAVSLLFNVVLLALVLFIVGGR